MHQRLKDEAASPPLADDVPHVLLDERHVIVAANDAYCAATERRLDELLGVELLRAFPSAPGDPAGDASGVMRACLDHVLRSGLPHTVLALRHDIRLPSQGGRFVPREWTVSISPVLDGEGRAVGSRHRIDHVGWPTRRPGGSLEVHPSVRAEMTGLADHARRMAAERDVAVRDNQRLARALGAMVAPAPAMPASTGAADHRRRQLWDMVMLRHAGPVWGSWSRALCQTVVDVLPAVHGCGITVRGADGARTLLAASDSWAELLEALDETMGEGPATTAFWERVPTLVADLGSVQDWPAFGPAAVDAGCTGVSAFPISAGPVTVGALTLYLRQGRRLAAPGLRDATLLVDLATTVLLHDLDGLTTDPDGSPARAGVVAQAVGVVAGQVGVGVAEALSLLRARAFASGRLLDAVAGAVVAGIERVD